ncbi:50S ribosomal protein L10 [Bacteroidales bacterium OttesenSCG-928-K03]|nr:50S ribosomal protein L10 [Odoribacter sp. OttesenSCG-928-L07]MDL2239216.1 50S ribosomal protein L10 [Bacteroidales bacterium OttesenSCG-928-L14]MDL2240070.1 50S ribosomal protein L10 [Bacteroidales bacterium OttesenSCG-928-K22]MDL2242327.1 50S ribosomal protein L10 [Bacteroidales bacterium OttesenSCG-928-K03]
MRKEDKSNFIAELTEMLKANSVIYLADIGELNATNTSNLRRLCFQKEVQLMVVKNALLRKAMEQSGIDFGELPLVLKGHTALMFASTGNLPAKLILEVRKTLEKPILKGAYVGESIYVGDNYLKALSEIKSKDELIGDIIFLLQSPARNVISALQSGGHKISGILETLSNKTE